jgi:hypothetical protein
LGDLDGSYSSYEIMVPIKKASIFGGIEAKGKC